MCYFFKNNASFVFNHLAFPVFLHLRDFTSFAFFVGGGFASLTKEIRQGIHGEMFTHLAIHLPTQEPSEWRTCEVKKMAVVM